MGAQRFANLARALAPRASRRRLVRGSAGGDAGGLLRWRGASATAHDASSPYIEFVRVSKDPGHIELKLTAAGVELAAASCDGARRVQALAERLYARIPAADRPAEDFAWWGSGRLTDEIRAHAIFARARDTVPLLPAPVGAYFAARGNPVNIDFADYADPGGRGLNHRMQQRAFSLIARCSLRP